MPGVFLIGNRQNSRRGPIETVICPLGSFSPINISFLCVRVHREKALCIDINVNTILAMQAPLVCKSIVNTSAVSR